MSLGIRSVVMLGVILCSFVVPAQTFAQKVNVTDSIQKQIKAGGKSSGLGAADGSTIDPRLAVASVIQILLQVLGIIFVTLIFTAGFWLMTARGEESKIEKAHNTMQTAVIGLIIILLSYSITWFVGKKIREGLESTTYTTPVGGQF